MKHCCISAADPLLKRVRRAFWGDHPGLPPLLPRRPDGSQDHGDAVLVQGRAHPLADRVHCRTDGVRGKVPPCPRQERLLSHVLMQKELRSAVAGTCLLHQPRLQAQLQGINFFSEILSS